MQTAEGHGHNEAGSVVAEVAPAFQIAAGASVTHIFLDAVIFEAPHHSAVSVRAAAQNVFRQTVLDEILIQRGGKAPVCLGVHNHHTDIAALRETADVFRCRCPRGGIRRIVVVRKQLIHGNTRTVRRLDHVVNGVIGFLHDADLLHGVIPLQEKGIDAHDSEQKRQH